MSHPIQNWKPAAYTAIAEYYKVKAEQAAYEERLEKARRDCVRAGVVFRYGDDPDVRHVNAAYACNCGAVITYEYSAKIPATHVCEECAQKSATATREDAIASGLPDPAAPAPVAPPPDAKTAARKAKKADPEIGF